MQLACFIFLLKFIKMLWSYKKCQKMGVGRGLGQIRAKNVLAQTIPDKICGTIWNKPVKRNRRRKALFFVCFLTAVVKV